MEFRDTYKLKGLRKKLVETLRKKGIKDERILQAIAKIPRHYFLDSAFSEQAYEDKAFPIGEGQTISQPFTVAYQTEALEVEAGHKVLEIGTGSGFQASILCELRADLYTVERIKALYHQSKSLLKLMGYDAKCFQGDGSQGLKSYAPYDRILVTAAAPEIPQLLVDQLKTHGIMIIPVGKRSTQDMLRVHKVDNTEIRIEKLDKFKFVPLIGDSGWEK